MLRGTGQVAVFFIGLTALVVGSIDVVRAAGPCKGTGVGGGSGGGIICSGDCPVPQTCDIKTSHPAPTLFIKSCACTGVEEDPCCHVEWWKDEAEPPESQHSFHKWGDCNIPGCPAGVCTLHDNSGVWTATCD